MLLSTNYVFRCYTISTLVSFLIASCYCHAAPAPRSTLLSSPLVSTVWAFPNQTSVENLAVRPNGQILVTRSDVPDLYQVDPSGSSPAKLIHSFSSDLALAGITEVAPDIFALLAGNASSTIPPIVVPGSFSIYKIDFNAASSPTMTKVTNMPSSLYLNGACILNTRNGTILVADSTAGSISRVNTVTGDHAVVLQDNATMGYPANAAYPIGVNGVHVKRGYAYYTNSLRGLFSRVKIHEDGTAAGPFETIYAGDILFDDFALGRDGTAYIAGSNLLTRVALNGTAGVVADDMLIAGSTSVVFGKGGKVLFVGTNGGINDAGTAHLGPARVVAVSL